MSLPEDFATWIVIEMLLFKASAVHPKWILGLTQDELNQNLHIKVSRSYSCKGQTWLIFLFKKKFIGI